MEREKEKEREMAKHLRKQCSNGERERETTTWKITRKIKKVFVRVGAREVKRTQA